MRLGVAEAVEVTTAGGRATFEQWIFDSGRWNWVAKALFLG